MLLSMYQGIVTSPSSVLASHSHESTLHFTLFKDATLNTKGSTFTFLKWYGFSIVLSNSSTILSPLSHKPCNTKQLEKRTPQ